MGSIKAAKRCQTPNITAQVEQVERKIEICRAVMNVLPSKKMNGCVLAMLQALDFESSISGKRNAYCFHLYHKESRKGISISFNHFISQSLLISTNRHAHNSPPMPFTSNPKPTPAFLTVAFLKNSSRPTFRISFTYSLTPILPLSSALPNANLTSLHAISSATALYTCCPTTVGEMMIVSISGRR